MPDIDMLLILSELYGVTIGEILNGEKQTAEEIIKKSNETIYEVVRNDRYTVKERTKFWKQKWIKEHIALIIITIVICVALFPAAYFLLGEWKSFGGGIITLISIFAFSYLHNKMMIYVESKVTDSIHNKH